MNEQDPSGERDPRFRVHPPEPAGPPAETPPAPSARPVSQAADSSLRERCLSIHRQLGEILARVFQRQGIPAHRRPKVTIDLRAEFEIGAESSTSESGQRFANELLDQIQTRALEGREGAPFAVGRLHCFWCNGSDCRHSRPPQPSFVFGGYSPTGEPVWLDFASFALERGHPLIDWLYRDAAPPIHLLVPGSELHREQLGVYGKGSARFRVLAQLLIGYVPLRASMEGGSSRGKSRLALSIQVVECREPRTRHYLNVVGLLGDGGAAELELEGHLEPRLADALAAARVKLSDLSLGACRPARARKGAAGHRPSRGRESDRLALRLLQRLARNLERIYRQSHRRTQHSQTRHLNRERPASTALRDALAAKSADIYRDVQTDTWVVIGPRNRVHVFNDAGQHVTSVVYPGESIRKRTASGKWKREEEPRAVNAFLERIRGSLRT